MRQARVAGASLRRPVFDDDPRGRLTILIAGLKSAAAFLRAAQDLWIPTRRPVAFAARGEQRKNPRTRCVEVKASNLGARKCGHGGSPDWKSWYHVTVV